MADTKMTMDLIVAAISRAKDQLGARYAAVHHVDRVADAAATITYDDGTVHKIAIVATPPAPPTAS